jgi:ParB-like chromosome segregation protein Spo0J
MKVEMWPIETLIPYARNPRQISQIAIDKVAASIQEFGFRQPIVVDQNGVIIVGHVRLLAAQQLELTKVPVHVATELTVAQVNAYRLADNRTNQEATWDMEALALELANLKLEEFNLDLTGFNLDEIDELLAKRPKG